MDCLIPSHSSVDDSNTFGSTLEHFQKFRSRKKAQKAQKQTRRIASENNFNYAGLFCAFCAFLRLQFILICSNLFISCVSCLSWWLSTEWFRLNVERSSPVPIPPAAVGQAPHRSTAVPRPRY